MNIRVLRVLVRVQILIPLIFLLPLLIMPWTHSHLDWICVLVIGIDALLPVVVVKALVVKHHLHVGLRGQLQHLEISG